MTEEAQGLAEHRLEIFIGNLLRLGVITAAALVVLGGFIYLFRRGLALPDYKTFKGEPAELRHVEGIIRYAFAFHGRGLIQLGFLVLIATPIARVIFCLVAFLRQKDRLYAAVSFTVLAVLCYSLFRR